MPSLDYLLCANQTRKNAATTCNGVYSSKQLPSRPTSRRCNALNCRKTAKRGGRCIAHGGGNKCAMDGCTTSVVSRGLCVAHGGGKRCQAPTCAKSAQSGGFCWVHGGGKKCGYHGCLKRAQSGGACIAHGGGKRCRINGCNKVVQYDGLCVGHGGYRRCGYLNCDGRAMANDSCHQHGGSSVCLRDCCYKRAVRGGMCTEHKAQASRPAGVVGAFVSPSRPRRRPSDKAPDRPVDEQRATRQGRDRTKSWERTRTVDAKRCVAGTTTLLDDHVSSSPSRPPFVQLGHVDDEKEETTTTTWCKDSPRAPGFAALLNADETFASFSSMRAAARDYKVYPLLPSIRSLQPVDSLLKWGSNTKPECHERADTWIHSDEATTVRRVLVHSCYYHHRSPDGE